MVRKIIHVDMDAFYASVEQRGHPELRGEPVAVGRGEPCGIVNTASYEAHRFDVHSTMAMCKARRLCSQLIIAPHRGEVYHEVSIQVREIFCEYTDIIEPISLDEVFLDTADNKKGIVDSRVIALEIKRKIQGTTHLIASTGVSFNKFLAKVASDYRRPDGLFEISREEAYDFISQLKIEKFWNIGSKATQLMHKMGVFTGEQLRHVSEQHLIDVFGKMGSVYYHDARGDDERPVISHWIRRSVSCERTFQEDLALRSAVLIELYRTVSELIERIKEADFKGKTLTLKIEFDDFTQITRSTMIEHYLQTEDQVLSLTRSLLREVDYSHRTIRLIRLSVNDPHVDDKGEKEILWEEGWIDGFQDV